MCRPCSACWSSGLLWTVNRDLSSSSRETQALSCLQQETSAGWLALDSIFFTFLWLLQLQLCQLLSIASELSVCPFHPTMPGSKARQR